MGVFSFLSDLTGKKDDKPDTGEVATAEAEGMPPADTTPSAPAAAAPPKPEPAVPQTPYTPPEAWKAEGMAAPKPEK